MVFISILLLPLMTYAATICLPKGWKFSWTFSSTDEISFTLKLAQETLDSYQWVGVGFRSTGNENSGMTGADIINILTGPEVLDSYATCNCQPTKDTELSGEDNLSNVSYDQELLEYRWTKPINSQDPNDMIYTQDSFAYLLWACGKIKDGVQLRHLVPDRGIVKVQLSENYTKDCEEIIELI